MPGFQFYFELIGAVAFAISGAALAVKKHMDLFGVAMMGMTTAVGGGILRDLLLGITPPAALRDPLQALVAIATSLLVFLVWKRFHPEGDHRNWEALLLVADSIGLGIFSVRLIDDQKGTAWPQGAVHLQKAIRGSGPEIYGFKCGRQIKRTIPKGEARHIPLQNLAAACLESLAVHTLGLFHGYF